MFEHRSQPLLSKKEFARRLLGAFGVTFAIVVVSLLIGTSGYYWAGEMSWDEAFPHTCLMLSGHDVQHEESSPAGRLFAGVFVLFARLVFVTLVAVLFVPLLHRIFHRLHLDPQHLGEIDEPRK